jgi:hypothetical protein
MRDGSAGVVMNCIRTTTRTTIGHFAQLWIRRKAGASFLTVILLAPSQGSAQALESFEDLALRINLGDQLQVEDQSGSRTRGRLIRLTRDGIVIQTDAGEKRFTRDTVREIALRGQALRKRALLGAGLFAVLGAVATCSHEDGGDCIVVGALRAAPIGAGAGLAMGALVSSFRSIYRTPEGGPSVPQSRDAGQASLLEDLALRVNLGDQLRVEDYSGVRTTGRLTRLTADEFTIHTGAGDARFTRETVRQVARRERPLRMAVLVGAGVGAATAAVAACTGSSREECVDAPIMAAALGAGLGLAAGVLMHRTTIVYPEAKQRTLVLPMISPHVVGVRVDRHW